jgi:hypothetical protein
MAIFLKLLHVLTALWQVSRQGGRGLTLAQAGQITDIPRMRSSLTLKRVDRAPHGDPSLHCRSPFGLLTAWVQGAPLLGFLQGARSNWLRVSLLRYLSAILRVPFIFVRRGKAFAAVLEEAGALGAVMTRLRGAFADHMVCADHIYEFAAIPIVLT